MTFLSLVTILIIHLTKSDYISLKLLSKKLKVNIYKKYTNVKKKCN